MRKLTALLLCAAMPALAEPFSIRIDQGAAIYSTLDVGGDDRSPSAYLQLAEVLAGHPEVRTLVLQGDFGSITRSLAIARLIQDYGLAIEVRTTCGKTCAFMFLAGTPHTVRDGASLYASRMELTQEDAEAEYDARRSVYGWESEAGYAAYMFDLGQQDVALALESAISYMSFDQAEKLLSAEVVKMEGN